MKDECPECHDTGGVTITDSGVPSRWVPCPVCCDPHNRFQWKSEGDRLWAIVETMKAEERRKNR